MPTEPEDDIERLFAEEEAAIRDDGFSKRVEAQAKPAKPWRQTVLYGSGFLGAGFAVGGVVQLYSKAPPVTTWLPDFSGVMQGAAAETTFSGALDGVQLAIVAVAAGVTFLVAAVAAAQTR